MKIYDRVHQLRIQFNVTPEIARYVYVYIIMGKEGCYLVAVSYTHLTLPTIRLV